MNQEEFEKLKQKVHDTETWAVVGMVFALISFVMALVNVMS